VKRLRNLVLFTTLVVVIIVILSWMPIRSESEREVTVQNLYQTQIAYVQPWAIYQDLNGNYWIRGDYQVDDTEFGTRHVKIQRWGSRIIVQRDTLSPADISAIEEQKSDTPLTMKDSWNFLPVTMR
jgi:hypothetical protein